jgi:hypothetical protein
MRIGEQPHNRGCEVAELFRINHGRRRRLPLPRVRRGTMNSREIDLMTAVAQSRNRYLDRPAPSSLADVIETILDKGMVIDIYGRVSLVGIEILFIDARIVIASVDTYLRFAEAVNRLDIADQQPGVTELVGDE